MQRSELEKLSRKELQALAKEHGVKANLSNNDILAKLSELSVDTEEESKTVEIVSTELTSVEETPAVVEEASVLPEAEVVAEVPIVENIVLFNAEDVTVGDSVEVDVSGLWQKAVVKRVNKKAVRVSLMDTREEFTVKFDEIRVPGTTFVERRHAGVGHIMSSLDFTSVHSYCIGKFKRNYEDLSLDQQITINGQFIMERPGTTSMFCFYSFSPSFCLSPFI